MQNANLPECLKRRHLTTATQSAQFQRHNLDAKAFHRPSEKTRSLSASVLVQRGRRTYKFCVGGRFGNGPKLPYAAECAIPLQVSACFHLLRDPPTKHLKTERRSPQECGQREVEGSKLDSSAGAPLPGSAF